MLENQCTISKPITISGIGLHKGNQVQMTFVPSFPNTGIRFIRKDLKDSPEIPALIDHVVDLSRGTSLGIGDAIVHTVEHVLSAVYGLGIDNLIIELTANEPPVMDGSAKPFVDALLESELVESDVPKEYVEVEKTLTYHDEEKQIDIVTVPSSDFRITYMVDYKNPALGTQYTSMYSLKEEYISEFASARTFCFLSEVEVLKEQGLIKGGNLDNAVVIVDRQIEPSEFDRLKTLFNIKHTKIRLGKGILDDRKLRFPNEPVRHKVLDLIGDLALLGMPIKGHVLAARAGHAAHVELVRMLRKMYLKHQITKKYQKGTTEGFVFDIRAIEKILPHRFPFLLVDRIMELVPAEKVVAIKNVTINEPFFQGHFPNHAIMPGVLIIEAMGQSGGVLLLNTVDNPEDKVVYFTGLDKVKFRKPVLPGDQIRFTVEMVFFRRGICRMKGEAHVEGSLVAEAEMQAVIVDR
jgi:UDP-3-O-[3-hydroxymyristoyl] N-acetylglucosamine deacetylase/3-hydroxyacyl-[acyl-carrier-protein] dehydratase